MVNPCQVLIVSADAISCRKTEEILSRLGLETRSLRFPDGRASPHRRTIVSICAVQ